MGIISDKAFGKWMVEVDTELERACGMSADDVVDYDWRELFDAGVAAHSAVAEWNREEGPMSEKRS